MRSKTLWSHYCSQTVRLELSFHWSLMHQVQLSVNYNLSHTFRDSWNWLKCYSIFGPWTSGYIACSETRSALTRGSLISDLYRSSPALRSRCVLSPINIHLAKLDTLISFHNLPAILDTSPVKKMLQAAPCLTFQSILCHHLRLLTFIKWPRPATSGHVGPVGA